MIATFDGPSKTLDGFFQDGKFVRASGKCPPVQRSATSSPAALPQPRAQPHRSTGRNLHVCTNYRRRPRERLQPGRHAGHVADPRAARYFIFASTFASDPGPIPDHDSMRRYLRGIIATGAVVSACLRPGACSHDQGYLLDATDPDVINPSTSTRPRAPTRSASGRPPPLSPTSPPVTRAPGCSAASWPTSGNQLDLRAEQRDRPAQRAGQQRRRQHAVRGLNRTRTDSQPGDQLPQRTGQPTRRPTRPDVPGARLRRIELAVGLLQRHAALRRRPRAAGLRPSLTVPRCMRWRSPTSTAPSRCRRRPTPTTSSCASPAWPRPGRR